MVHILALIYWFYTSIFPVYSSKQDSQFNSYCCSVLTLSGFLVFSPVASHSGVSFRSEYQQEQEKTTTVSSQPNFSAVLYITSKGLIAKASFLWALQHMRWAYYLVVALKWDLCVILIFVICYESSWEISSIHYLHKGDMWWLLESPCQGIHIVLSLLCNQILLALSF